MQMFQFLLSIDRHHCKMVKVIVKETDAVGTPIGQLGRFSNKMV